MRTGMDQEILSSVGVQLTMKFQLKCWKIKTFPAFKFSIILFIMLINVKMTRIFGILTFICMMKFVLS